MNSMMDVAENLMKLKTTAEIEQLVGILQLYLKKASPAKAIEQDNRELKRKIEEKRASASEMYLAAPASVCPCCRR